jgi:hypothetical protein
VRSPLYITSVATVKSDFKALPCSPSSDAFFFTVHACRMYAADGLRAAPKSFQSTSFGSFSQSEAHSMSGGSFPQRELHNMLVGSSFNVQSTACLFGSLARDLN